MPPRPSPAPSGNRALHGVVNHPPSLAVGPTSDVLRRLDLQITRRLDGMLQGDYRGLVPGHGSELGETREYQPGDDVRRIDWNVSARTMTPHIRQTIADRELETWALVDFSPSLGWGTAECEKRDLALAATAAVGFLTERTGNRMGAMVFEGGRPVTLPARGGRPHLQAVLHRLARAAQASDGPVDLAGGLHRLDAMMRRRGLAVVVSDFLGPTDWERPLGRLATRHETLVIEVVDPRELELPDVGIVELVDPESGATLEVQTSDAKLRARFSEAARAQRDTIARAVRAAGADHLVLRTDRDWLLDVVRFVSSRRDRVDALRGARR